MILDPYTSFAAALFKAWQSGERRVRISLITGIILVLVAIVVILLAKGGYVDQKITETIAGVIGGIAGLITVGVIAYQGLIDQQAREQKNGYVNTQRSHSWHGILLGQSLKTISIETSVRFAQSIG